MRGLSGSLGATPLAQLIVHLARFELTGTLVLNINPGEKPCKIVFEQGAPTKAYTPWKVAYLGEVLFQMQKLDASTHDWTLEHARRARCPHGAVLLEAGLVDQATLTTALRAQTEDRVEEMFRRYSESSSFSFYPDEDGLEGWGGGDGTPVDPWHVVWRGVSSRAVVDAAVAETLSLLDQSPVAIRPDAQVERFGFDPDVAQVTRWLSVHPISVADLLTVIGIDTDRMKLCLYVLFLAHCLAFRDPACADAPRAGLDPFGRQYAPAAARSGTMERVSAPSDRPAEPGTGSSPPSSNVPSSRLEQVRERLAAARASCPPMAPPPTSRPPEPAPSEPSRASTAAPPPADATPPDGPSSEAGGPSSLRVEADRQLRNARRKRSDGELELAERYAREALAARPNAPEINAELAVILALQPEKQALGDLGEPLDLADAAIRAAPGLGIAHYARGVVHQALGFHKQAYKDFQKAVRGAPPCTAAAAELQAYVRRYRETGALDPAGDSAESSRRGGVLSNLFKPKS